MNVLRWGNSDTWLRRCIGGASVKKSLLCVVGLLALGTLVAAADELPTAPSTFILGPTRFLPWTGFFVGANAGYGWAHSSVNYTPNDPASLAGTCGGVGKGTCLTGTDFMLNGATAGGQIGYDWQISPLWLVGVQGDFQWANFESGGTSAFHLGNVGTTNALTNQTVESFGTLRVRLGVVPLNALLLYGTAGLAFGQLKESTTIPNPLATGTGSVSSGGFSYRCVGGSPTCFAGSSSGTQWGWTGGLGGEFRITNNISLLTELLYAQLTAPSATVGALSAVAGTAPSSISATFPTVKFVVWRGGVNFRF
jgi:outer membrane immunogenic protein